MLNSNQYGRGNCYASKERNFRKELQKCIVKKGQYWNWNDIIP